MNDVLRELETWLRFNATCQDDEEARRWIEYADALSALLREREILTSLLSCAGTGLAIACEGGVPEKTLMQLWIDPYGLRSDIANALGRDALLPIPEGNEK